MPFTAFASRVNARSVQVAQRDERGTGIAEGLSLLGRTAGAISEATRKTDEAVREIDHDIAMREQKRDDDALLTQVAVAKAQTDADLRAFEDENKNRADFATVYAAEVDKRYGALRGMIGNNDRVMQRFEAPLTETAANEKVNAQIYERQVNAKAQGQALTMMVETYGNGIITKPETYGDAVKSTAAAIDGMQNVPDALKPAMKLEAAQSLTVAMVQARIERGEYEAMDALIKGGSLDAYLGNKKQPLLARVDAERNTARIAADHAVAQSKATFREEKQAIDSLIAAGVDVPQTRLDAAIATATRLGMGGEATALGVSRQRIATNRQFAGRTATERGATIMALAAKQAAGKATPAEQITLDQLRVIQKVKTDEIAGPLKAEYANGVQGRLRVAEQLQSLPPEQRFAQGNAVDKGLGTIALLPSRARNLALEGQEDLPAVRETHFKGNRDRQAFDATVGRAGGDFNLADTKAAADAIYARKMRGANKAEFDESVYSESVNEALGATKGQDGQWRGGVGTYNGNKVILPDRRTNGQFRQLIEAHDFGAARYAGDKSLTRAQILAHYRPIYVGPDAQGRGDVYKFIDRQGDQLGRAGGGGYRMIVAN